ncbi:MAG: hypothetical protein OXC62_12975 [Aestuariivita sp.]|nr:hypothetical protein [Aestuariivita sp.]
MNISNQPKIYMANFGEGNWLWDQCRKEHTIVVLNDRSLHELWVKHDRDTYIKEAMQLPYRPAKSRGAASRWYNLMDVLKQTRNDLWIHREVAEDQLYWTYSSEDDIEFQEAIDRPSNYPIVIGSKSCAPWSSQPWSNIPLNVQKFLHVRSTLHELRSIEARHYILQSIGYDHTDPHENIFTDSVERMIDTAWKTCETATGVERTSATKIKNFKFSSTESGKKYVLDLLAQQNNRCALTGIPLETDQKTDDPEFLCSLDRIDSNGHYEPGNLQVVCRFINRWKGDDDNAEFKRLLTHLMSDQ